MATLESVKKKIQGLIDKSNETTGASDKDLTSAVGTLCAGFGGGGDVDLPDSFVGTWHLKSGLLMPSKYFGSMLLFYVNFESNGKTYEEVIIAIDADGSAVFSYSNIDNSYLDNAYDGEWLVEEFRTVKINEEPDCQLLKELVAVNGLKIE